MVAIGGDLSVGRLLLAYRNGFFPWFSFYYNDEPLWYCQLKRFVIFPGEIHVSRSMKKLLASNRYTVTVNEDFAGVINGCSTVDGRNENHGAWLGDDMIEAYTELHRQGKAMSVEVWEMLENDDGEKQRALVGGIYGVTMCNAFFGESMFSRVPSGSKIALIHVARIAAGLGWYFIDCQFETPHLKSMGGRYISYEEYMVLLNGKRNSEGRIR
jgi:leucyl/phenylalanyl-tRNA--protein transferase